MVGVSDSGFVFVGPDGASHRDVPLFVMTQDSNGETKLDRTVILTEKTAKLDIDVSNLYIINSCNRGFCEWFLLYVSCIGDAETTP